jgi:hypothetical protein
MISEFTEQHARVAVTLAVLAAIRAKAPIVPGLNVERVISIAATGIAQCCTVAY